MDFVRVPSNFKIGIVSFLVFLFVSIQIEEREHQTIFFDEQTTSGQIGFSQNVGRPLTLVGNTALFEISIESINLDSVEKILEEYSFDPR